MSSHDEAHSDAVNLADAVAEINENDPSTELSETKLNIPIHSILQSSQSQHGLRHSDYTQYRSYCTRRLSRLRHAKPVKAELSKVTNPSTGGKGRHAFRVVSYYRDDELLSEIASKHENFMLIELTCAERAWSYAMELKVAYEEKQSGGNGNGGSRGHFMQRLKMAVKSAVRLEEMALKAADQKTITEATAYAAWMKGNLSLEKSEYQSAFVQFGKSLAICRAFGAVDVNDSTTDVPSLEMKDYFTARAENIIEPLLRFCQYELKEEGMSENDLIALLADAQADYAENEKLIEASNETTPTTASTTASILFRNQNVPISVDALRVALLKIETLVSRHEKTKKSKRKEMAFLDLLSGYDDAISIVNKEYKEMEKMNSGPAVDAKKREIQCLMGYLKFMKLKVLMSRNEELVNELRMDVHEKDMKLDEIVHLYDVLLQDARTIASLPGGIVEEDNSSMVPSVEDDFLLEANANILRYRCLRCYYLALIYMDRGEYKKAIGLLKHSLLLASEAAEELNACASDNDDEAQKMIESILVLEKKMTGAICRAQAYAYLKKIGRLSLCDSNAQRSLLERLDDFDGGSVNGGLEKYHLAHVPLKMEYIPCKPTFFDIALNHVGKLPEEEFKQRFEKHAEAKSSRFLGWFTRG